jgi:DmsE family decaheme c-type cytochrome
VGKKKNHAKVFLAIMFSVGGALAFGVTPAAAYPGYGHADAAASGALAEVQDYLENTFGVETEQDTPGPINQAETSAPVPEVTRPLVLAAAEPAQAATPATAPTANYINPQICRTCHQLEAQNWAHTLHSAVFTLSPQNDREGQTCQACHGPASLHLANPAAEGSIIRFTHGGGTPVDAQNAQCMGCHQGGQRIFWRGSTHENFDVACSDCHNPQAQFSLRGLTARQSINETCFQCHAEKRAEFRRRSHKPLLEGQVSCSDCHNPHGSTTAPLLKANSVNEVCYTCHAEKRGPFLFEHAPVRDNCTNCHAPHGSNHERLLVTAPPLLCQQCHIQPGHDGLLLTRGNMAGGLDPDVRLLGRGCATCHSQVHGSNSPAGARLQR